MKRLATALVCATLFGVSNVAAVCPPGGGNDETSENFSAAGGIWRTITAATPGTVPGGLSSSDLLITELAYTGNNQEFVEIYNPTSNAINLDQYYLSDDVFVGPPLVGYWRIVLGGAYTIGTTTDFNVKFPAGTSIAAGQVMVIYMGAVSPPAPFALGTPDFEIVNATGAAVPDMVAIGNTPGGASPNGLVTNGGESVMLYKWDGICDLVCDVDYFAWATASASARMDKTGVSIDGIDADAVASSYLADTAFGSQSLGQTHAAGGSIERIAVGLHNVNGNGCMIIVVPTINTTWSSIKSQYR
jgi:hypothetical protein